MPRPCGVQLYNYECKVEKAYHRASTFQTDYGHICLAMAVSEVYASWGRGDRTSWKYLMTGAICFVADHRRSSYFLRLFYPPNGRFLWEQEIYKGLTYRELAPYFHSFEGDDYIVGFNFADETEAKVFIQTLIQVCSSKRNKHPAQGVQAVRKVLAGTTGWTMTLKPNEGTKNGATKKTMKKEKKGPESPRKLKKTDIGSPTEFNHITHLEWVHEKSSYRLKLNDPRLMTTIKEVVDVTKFNSMPNRKCKKRLVRRRSSLSLAARSTPVKPANLKKVGANVTNVQPNIPSSPGPGHQASSPSWDLVGPYTANYRAYSRCEQWPTYVCIQHQPHRIFPDNLLGDSVPDVTASSPRAHRRSRWSFIQSQMAPCLIQREDS